jgi:hypothetical protein
MSTKNLARTVIEGGRAPRNRDDRSIVFAHATS